MKELFEYEFMNYKPFEEDSLLIKVYDRNFSDTQIEDIIGTCHFIILSDNDLKETARVLIYSKDKNVVDYLLNESITEASFCYSQKSYKSYFNNSDGWDNKKFHFKGLVRQEMPEFFELDKTDWLCFTYERGSNLTSSSSDENKTELLRIVYNREKKLKDLLI